MSERRQRLWLSVPSNASNNKAVIRAQVETAFASRVGSGQRRGGGRAGRFFTSPPVSKSDARFSADNRLPTPVPCPFLYWRHWPTVRESLTHVLWSFARQRLTFHHHLLHNCENPINTHFAHVEGIVCFVLDRVTPKQIHGGSTLCESQPAVQPPQAP
ncbi:hypothetical protein DM02DRAFT_648983 [Periconia macrospinosa]|uniref:Uncharacterized protein n=1 Tax=Periconia macrospinosa TaxID=97972 RepID=A0A2V1EAD6_9PLEO|nr:hypothetical protein DM02DRAFT_648983 [Periconia macrospinosa]